MGDDIHLYNSWLKLFAGKLRYKWSGPFRVTNVYPSGAIKLEGYEKMIFMVNRQRLKHYNIEGLGAAKIELLHIKAPQ